MFINSKSLLFKITTLYIFITALNVTVFNIIVWENQIELIMDNAILESQHRGAGIKYSVDNIINDSSEITPDLLTEISKKIEQLNINNFSIYKENGDQLFANIDSNKKDRASLDELKMINRSITKKSFEDRIFTHRLNKKEKSIDLFIPLTYSTDKMVVLFTTLKMTDIDKQMGLLYRQCAVVSFVIILIHAFFGLAVAKMALFPLGRLLTATKEIAKGNFAVRVPISGTDEIGLLASSFNEMSTSVAHMQDEAKGANPLTSLPGNISIANNIDYHIGHHHLFAVLYCDLDNFKAYNDKYGFTRGDDAILYSKDKLLEAAETEGVHDVFVGHEGGDDFVVIAPYDCWELYASRFIRIFDRDIKQFYSETDAKNGYIASVNRQGEAQNFPLMSMSVAVVTNAKKAYTHHAEIVTIAAELKKFVKKFDGSNYKLDERSD
jgi:diguanylate cyclase (GGDEF)-like protein